MTILHIDLLDGFINDDVIITMDGVEVYNKTAVKTRFQISFADSIELDTAEEDTTIMICLPLKGLSNTITLKTTMPIYLGVSIPFGDKIIFDISSTQKGLA